MIDGRGWGSRILRIYLPVAVCLVVMLFPFYWMLIASIKPNRELYNAKIMPLVVYQPTLKHYHDLFADTNFLTWTYNTMLVAVITTAASLILGAMIAYPLARMNFPGPRSWRSGSPPLIWCPSRSSSSRWPTSSTSSSSAIP